VVWWVGDAEGVSMGGVVAVGGPVVGDVVAVGGPVVGGRRACGGVARVLVECTGLLKFGGGEREIWG
jgi:hypothetical protein